MVETRATLSRDGVDTVVPVGTGDEIIFRFRDIRRASTGVHAMVAIFINKQLLAYDTFNVGRNEERNRLAKSAHSAMGQVVKDVYPLEVLKHDLDVCGLEAPRQYFDQRFVVSEAPDGDIEPPAHVLTPYILDGAGTITFAPPDSGKSWLLQLMGTHIANGLNTIWQTVAAPVIFINLERPEQSVHYRDQMIRNAMGLSKTRIHYLHARGQALTAITGALRRFTDEQGAPPVILLDSLSRGQLGALNEDETANRFVDMMNLISHTWVAIGHTPRGDSNHLFGSVHFDAGEDIGVKVSSEQRGTTLGLSLVMVKNNHGPKAAPQYIALEFDDRVLVAIRSAREQDFPDLAGQLAKPKNTDVLESYLGTVGEATPEQIWRNTGLDRSNLRKWARPGVVEVVKQGQNSVYRLVATQEEPY